LLGTSNKENKIKKPQRLILTIFLAFAPLFFTQQVLAETREEYNAIIAEAEAKVTAAETALEQAEKELLAAQELQTQTNQAVTDAQKVLNDKTEVVKDKAEVVALAQAAVEEAQYNYDNNLIEDPTWIPETHEVEYTRLVPKTEIVLVKTLVPTTTYTTTGGVKAEVFDRIGFNNAPPLPTENEVPIHTTTVSEINFNWGSGNILGSSRSEDIIVRFTGNLMVPVDGNYQFYTPADDGTKLTIAGMNLIDDWRDKGGGGAISEPAWIRAGILYPFTLHYYENGGGAAVWFQTYSPQEGFKTIPSSWLGTSVIEETTYEEVITYEERTTLVEEKFFVTEIIPNQITPLIKNPELLALIQGPTETYNTAVANYDSASLEVSVATAELNILLEKQTQNTDIINLAQQNVTTKQEELNVVEESLQAIPPFREPTPTPEETQEPVEEPETNEPEPLPEPVSPSTPEVSEPELPVDVSTVDPQSLSTEQVAALVSVANEILNNSEQGSPEYEEALEALFVAAQADDIVLSEELAAIPGAEALVGAINFIGNVGADMSPKVREESEKIVVTAIVAVGAAVNAATGAAMMAAPASASSNIIRRNT
jgi:hypothetical protein